ncbi:MAG: hypothetical protein C4558_09050 [Dehalococcoidia bacterium]|nr:MAG: hypothetical protein C4558_09050 [Dehalococcoidia bacterium]
MTQAVVLTSLGELEAHRDRFPVDTSRALVPVAIEPTSEERIGWLAEAAERALDELRVLDAAEREQRQTLEGRVARARRLREDAARLEAVAGQLHEVTVRAGTLAGSVLDERARLRAGALVPTCGELATEAEVRHGRLLAEAEQIEAEPAVARLLEQERQQEMERTVQETLRRVEELMDHQEYGEARSLLTLLADESSAPDLSGTFETLRLREQAVKTRVAEDALRAARRCYRRMPAQAIDLLEPLDLDGVVEEIARHVYGCWLQACRRLGLLAAIHYTPAFAKGAVLMPAEDGRWEVVSALGLSRWERGRRFAPGALRGARPLA